MNQPVPQPPPPQGPDQIALGYATTDGKQSGGLLIGLAIGAVVLLIAGGVLGFMFFRTSQPAKPIAISPPPPAPAPSSAPQPVLLGPADFSESAEKMLATLNDGRDKFHEARYGKVIEVTGEVTGIRTDLTNRRFVALSGGVERTLGVRCFFAPANLYQIDDLSRGQRVVIRGRYETVEPDIVLLDCGVVRSEP